MGERGISSETFPTLFAAQNALPTVGFRPTLSFCHLGNPGRKSVGCVVVFCSEFSAHRAVPLFASGLEAGREGCHRTSRKQRCLLSTDLLATVAGMGPNVISPHSPARNSICRLQPRINPYVGGRRRLRKGEEVEVLAPRSCCSHWRRLRSRLQTRKGGERGPSFQEKFCTEQFARSQQSALQREASWHIGNSTHMHKARSGENPCKAGETSLPFKASSHPPHLGKIFGSDPITLSWE